MGGELCMNEIIKKVKSNKSSHNIDMQKTGQRIKSLLESAGYTPRMIQEYLYLSCVQPIYRWYRGQILPSIDHLFMLSELLNVHMEDFLIKKDVEIETYDIEDGYIKCRKKYYLAYLNKFYILVS